MKGAETVTVRVKACGRGEEVKVSMVAGRDIRLL